MVAKMSASAATIAVHHCVEEGDFCVVFAINTPQRDDSGIAHVVEHLIFRRSQSFDHAASLFQLTSLLPLTINASTVSGTTYFHCSSTNQQICLVGVDYLWRALTQLTITEQDLACELGVIAQELQAQSQSINCDGYAIDRDQLLASDESPNRTKLIGGSVDSVNRLSVERLNDYYRAHYHAKNITVYSASSQHHRCFVTALKKIVAASAPQARFAQSARARLPTGTAIAVAQLPTVALQESCWWLATSHSLFDELVLKVADLLDPSRHWLVTTHVDDCSEQGQWPLRIVCVDSASEALFRRINPLVDGMHSSVNLPEPNAKYQRGCGLLIAQHQATLSRTTRPIPPNAFIIRPLQFTKRRVTKDAAQQLSGAQATLVVPDVLIGLLSGLAKPGLDFGRCQGAFAGPPKILSHLARLRIVDMIPDWQLVAEFDANHYLCQVQVPAQWQATARCLSAILGALPTFLMPRLAGQCYAMGCEYEPSSGALFVYSAYAIAPSNGDLHIHRSLIALAANTEFVRPCLSLAKAKILSILSDKEQVLGAEITAVNDDDIGDLIGHISNLFALKLGK